MPIQDCVGETLGWRQPHLFVTEYELCRGDQVLGTLHFRSAWGSLTTAEIDGSRWTFKRMGFIQTRVTIRTFGEENDLAIFRNNAWSGGGILELPDGRSYRANTNFWRTRYEFTGPDDQPLIRYHTQNFLRMSGEMEILPPAAALHELPWLVMLGWYLAVMMHRDAAASAVIVTV